MDTFTMPSYREVVELLETFENMEHGSSPDKTYAAGPERMARLMKRLDSPHTGIPSIHIAGTKGKGSVANLAASALAAAGIRTGLYSSPHVDELRERIMINNRPLGEQRFVEAASKVLREAEAMREEDDAPSWFEIVTAIAFVAFKTARVEAMVLETGLGGRLDATNLPDIRNVAVGLTPISMDHEDILGHTLREIAGEKAEIIKGNVPVVTAAQEKGVMRLIRSKAKERQSRVFVVDKDITATVRKPVSPENPAQGQRVDFETWRNVYPDIPFMLLGEHQVANSELALGLVELFLEYMDREPLDSLVLKRAWRTLTLPARLEIVSREPWHIVDGAHNPASAWVATEVLLTAFAPTDRTLIFGVAADKDWRTMLRILAPLFKNAVFTPYESPRSVDPAELAAFAEQEFPELKTAAAIDVAHALELARGFTGGDGLILTTGSLYLAGEMRKYCRQEKASKR